MATVKVPTALGVLLFLLLQVCQPHVANNRGEIGGNGVGEEDEAIKRFEDDLGRLSEQAQNEGNELLLNISAVLREIFDDVMQKTTERTIKTS